MGRRNLGTRYLELARRCRRKDAGAVSDRGKSGLMRMADAYDRRGEDLASRDTGKNCVDFDDGE